MVFKCMICGHIYDEDIEKVKFSDLSDDWVCPTCGAPKSAFEPVNEELKGDDKKEEKIIRKENPNDDYKELTYAELGAILRNLGRGSNKLYKAEDEKLFKELSKYYEDRIEIVENSNIDKLIELVNKNLNEDLKEAKDVASNNKDRGTLRALTWSEKVTMMIKTLLDRYKKEGSSFIEHTNIWICTVCGFIFIGDNPPKLCPVCKVPDWKFEKVVGK